MQLQLFSDDPLPPEEESRIIERIAQKIVEYKLEAAAVLFLESWKPAIHYTGQLMRFLVVRPFLPFKEREADKLMAVLVKRSNIERILNRVEELKEQQEAREKGSVALNE